MRCISHTFTDLSTKFSWPVIFNPKYVQAKVAINYYDIETIYSFHQNFSKIYHTE